jgi:nucleotide-binding universal stress UspA family protein
MLPFRRILFPVDYSEPCLAIIPYVQEMACRFSSELTVCHAYTPLGAITHSEILVSDPELEAKAHSIEQDRLREFACRNFAGHRLQAAVELGEPGSVIDKLTGDRRADLVMLATHGHGPLRRLLLGSVTAKVLHDISAAVWTGVGKALMEHSVNVPYRSIACALDNSLEAESVLRGAAAMAQAYRADLWLIHVVPTPPAYPDLDLAEQTHALMEDAQMRMRELKAKLGVDAPHSVINGLLDYGIHHEIVRRKADLLITGRGHSIGTFSRLWSHLYPIIRDSPCPVLSI